MSGPPIYPFMKKVSKAFSNVLDEDNPYLHIAGGVPSSFVLSGNDILSVSSIGGVATYGLTKEPNSPSYDEANKAIHFEKSNTEGLINDSIGSDKFAGDDLPFSFAVVVRINTINNQAYRIWSAGYTGATSPFMSAGINSANQYTVQKRDNAVFSDGPSNGVLATNYVIITASSSGTVINSYNDGLKVFNGSSLDTGTTSLMNQFAIGYLRLSFNVNFTDMDVKEFALYDTEVSDARLQAWNNDLNAIYNVY